jgi:hypothetical protein
MKKTTVFILIILLIIPLFSAKSSNNILIRGVKIYQYNGNLTKLFKEFKSLNINTVLVGEKLAKNKNFYKTAKLFGIKTFIVFPVFCSPASPFKDKSLYAINGYGKIAKDEWVNFASPSNDKYRKAKLAELKNIIKQYNPDGISIDFIRYFVYWEKVFPETKIDPLLNTSFDDNSIKKMEKNLGFKLPSNLKTITEKARWILKYHKKEWVNWKTDTIASMVKDISETAKSIKPDILLNIHIIPWREKDFDNGIKVIAGQDIKKLSKFVDYISPMCYWHMVKRSPKWIHSVVKDIARFTNKPMLPSIQVNREYLKENITYKSFRNSFYSAIKKPSSGIIFWKWEFFENQPIKKKIFKEN